MCKRWPRAIGEQRWRENQPDRAVAGAFTFRNKGKGYRQDHNHQSYILKRPHERTWHLFIPIAALTAQGRCKSKYFVQIRKDCSFI